MVPYFKPLLNQALNDEDFEPQRALANVRADRAGLSAHSALQPVDGGVAYVVTPDHEDGARSSAQADFGNPGNRFVGSHFFDLDLRHSDLAGDQFKLFWQTALTGLNDGDTDRYNSEALTWSRATPFGVLGVTGQALDYSANDAGQDGQLREAQLSWLYPLTATLRSRLLIEVRADYINREFDLGDLGVREEYPSVQIGAHYSYSDTTPLGAADVDLSSTFRKGLRSKDADTGAKLDYLSWQPSISLNFGLGHRWNTGLLLAAQLADGTLPIESQWVLGGVDNIAAYRPGVAVGDDGVYSAIDLQYGGWSPLGVQLTPRVFAEYGLSRYARSLDDGVNHSSMLSDAGVELRAAWRMFSASVTAAAPIAHRNVPSDVRDASDASVLFKLTARL
nr:ShlB/FhaC/HecB family hemolysin secretion/activation protein [Solimonas marina]